MLFELVYITLILMGVWCGSMYWEL